MANNDEYPEYPEYRHSNESGRISRDFNEEAAAELSVPYRPADRSRLLREDALAKTNSAARATGWAALILAVLSWIVWPVLLGVTAAVVGFIAYRQGSRGFGIWSITLGLIAAAAYLVLIPIYYAVT